MNRNEAIITLLGNFAYFDNIIKESEIEKIKKIAKRRNISENVDEIINKNVKDQNRNIENFAASMATLNKELTDNDKLSLVVDIVDLIKVDGKVDEVEKYKISMLSVNWNIKIKKSVFK